AAEHLVHPEDRHVETTRPRAAENAPANGSVLLPEDDRHRAPVVDARPPDVPLREAIPDVTRLGRLFALDADHIDSHGPAPPPRGGAPGMTRAAARGARPRRTRP